ncbi:MAG: hypothetical protein A2X49_02130 [Lentisphaerae bacterium GWF2_52_8]|nr:MAG: hypothetical protein A2X49_02130 [Lentisphaerae bacterium GWF2_52_8]
MNELVKVNFAGQELLAVERNGKKYVAMKPIVEALGLDWSGQLKLIKNDLVLNEGIAVTSIPSEGGNQETICLPLDLLNGWLFKIPVSRYDDSRREIIIKYQRECYQVLSDYFQRGYAINEAITQAQLESLNIRIRALEAEKHNLELQDRYFGNRTQFGTPSKSTGRPRVKPRRGTYYSPRSRFVLIDTALLFPVEEVREGGR